MLMMQYSSGLSRFEVRKAQLHSREDTAMAKLHVLIRPALLLSTGLVALTGGIGGLVPALLMALVVFALGVLTDVLLRRWVRPLANDDQAVMAVREGLLRQCRVTDLVVGDTLVLSAGAIVPVDVQGVVAATPNWLTAKLQTLLQLTTPAGTILAGSRIAEDAQVQVVALGNQRFVFSQLLAALNDDAITNGNVLTLLLMRAAQGGFVSQPAFLTAEWQLRMNSEQNLDKIAATAAMTLVDNTQQTAAENAFRYNQDPVSWTAI